MATSAMAQTNEEETGNWSGFISVGAGVTPAYDGASSYDPIPFISADIKFRDVTLEVRGLTARLEVLSGLGSGNIYGGPAVKFRIPRDKDAGGPVALLNEIKFQTQGGGFIGVGLGGDASGQGRVKMEISGYGNSKGFESTGLISYTAIRNEVLFVNLDMSISYANGKFMRTYFGISPAESVRSGLAAYTPKSGIKDIGTGITIGYQFNGRWGLLANGNYQYLVGEAADSPIVNGKSLLAKGTGSRSQFVGGIGISYRF